MNKSLLKGSIVILPLLLLLFSCTDDKLNAGLEILPESDQLEASADTLSIECFTYKGIVGNALGTSASTANYPIGHILDNIFGETTAEFAAEFLYGSANKYTFDTLYSDSLISIKLYLNTRGLRPYGDENAIDIRARLLTSRYTYSGNTSQGVPSNYFNDTSSHAISTSHDDTPIGIDTVLLNKAHTYSVVELDTNLVNGLLNNSLTETQFYSMLPGFLFKADIRGNSIGALQNFYIGDSELVLKYKRRSSTKNPNDTVFYKTSSYDIGKFQFIYRNDHLTTYRDTIHEIEQVYLQGLGGTRGIIKINSLSAFKEKHGNTIGINLAELVLPINKAYLTDTAQFHLPKRILARGLSPNPTILPDDVINANYINGYLDRENLVYRINLSEYVNRYMLGDLDFVLLNITTAGNNVVNSTSQTSTAAIDYSTPSRVVLNSGLEGIPGHAYIRVIYTLIYN